MLKKLSLIIFSIILFLSILYGLLLKEQTSISSQKKNTKQVIHWKMANTWPRGMLVFEEETLRFADNIKKMSGGRLIIEVVPANIHKSPLGVFDFVRTGQYEMGHTASYYWKGKNVATSTLTTTPFGMNALEQYAWFYYGGGLSLQQDLYKKYGMLSFPAGNTGVQMGGWFRKEIKSLKDLEGLKMRIPGLAGDVVSRVGIKPTQISGGEIYMALQLGTIDALEWVGPAIDTKMGFQQIANYYYTGWHEPAAELQYLVNEKAFEALPDDLKQILRVGMRESAYDMYVMGYYKNAKSWKEMKQKYPNVKIKTFPKDVLDKMKEKTKLVLSEVKNESKDANKIIQSQQNFYKMAKEWTDISDKTYLEIR